MLQPEILKNALIELLTDMAEKDSDANQAREEFAERLSLIITSYIQSATILATPESVTSATMVAGAYPVVATNNLISILQ